MSIFRIPNAFPANPDVWIDASRETSPPSDGNGDRRPLNLAPGSDLEVEQTNGTNQPIWHDSDAEGRPYWEFEGDDRWATSQTFQPDAVTFAFVGYFTPGAGSSFFNPIMSFRSSDSGAYVELVVADDSRWAIDATDEDGNNHTSASFINTDERVAVVGTCSYTDNNIYCTAVDSSGNSDSAGSNSTSFTGGLGDTRPLFIGTDTVSADFFGPGYTFYHAFENISQSQADNFRDYLAKKWGIL